MQQNLYDIKYGFLTVKPTENALAKQQALLKNYADNVNLSDLDSEDLNQLIYHSEKVALCCREALENKIEENPIPYEPFDSLTGIPVNIETNGNMLRIKTPITLRRMYGGNYTKENYMLINYISASLIQYEREHGSLYMMMDYPFVMVIKRKSRKYNASVICDNDNIENGRVANAIFKALGHSDNAQIVDVFSCYRQCESEEQQGSEFVIFPKAELNLHLDELN